ncbi:MAG: phosphotransferase [Sporolactobacillus sp.]
MSQTIPLWKAEHAVTGALAKKLIDAQFPQLAPAVIEFLGKGYDNTVFLVNQNYVFRFPRRQIAVKLLKTELRLLPVLAGVLPLPTGIPLFADKSAPGLYPWPFAGYTLIAGQPAGRLPISAREKAAPQLAAFLRVLHQFDPQQAQLLGAPEDSFARLDIDRRRPALLKQIDQLERFELYPHSEVLRRFVKEMESCPLSGKKCLVHGDLHPRNLLFDEQQRMTGVIDWGDLHIGDPAIDLSIAYSFLSKKSRTIFFSHYGPITPDARYLAKWKAVFTETSLLTYAWDIKDKELLAATQESLDLALGLK